MAQSYTTEIRDGQKYVATVYRGTEYTLRRSQWGWEVTTRRVALGRWNMGGFKRFDTAAELVAGCKAFGDAASVIALIFGIETAAAVAA